MRVTSKYTEGVGERIRQVRRAEGWNQDDLGQRLGVSRQTINGYENERLMPPFKMIDRISELFGISPAWLAYGLGEPTVPLEMQTTLLGQMSYYDRASDKLAPEQRALIAYVKSDNKAAKKLAKVLWDEALNVLTRLEEE